MLKIQETTIFFSPYGKAVNLFREALKSNDVADTGVRCLSSAEKGSVHRAVKEIEGSRFSGDKGKLLILAVLGTEGDFDEFKNLAAQLPELHDELESDPRCFLFLRTDMMSVEESYAKMLPTLAKLQNKGIHLKISLLSDKTDRHNTVKDASVEAAAQAAVLCACGKLSTNTGVYTYDSKKLALEERDITKIAYTLTLNRLIEFRKPTWVDENGFPNNSEEVRARKQEIVRKLFGELFREDILESELDATNLSYELIEKSLPENKCFAVWTPQSYETMNRAWEEFIRLNRTRIAETISEAVLSDWLKTIPSFANQLFNSTEDVKQYLEKLSGKLRCSDAESRGYIEGASGKKPRLLENKEKFWINAYMSFIEKKRPELGELVKNHVMKQLKTKMPYLIKMVENAVRDADAALETLKTDDMYLDREALYWYQDRAQELFERISHAVDTNIKASTLNSFAADIQRDADFACASGKLWKAVFLRCLENVRNQYQIPNMITYIEGRRIDDIMGNKAYLWSPGVLQRKGRGDVTMECIDAFLRIDGSLSNDKRESVVSCASCLGSLQKDRQWDILDAGDRTGNICLMEEYRFNGRTGMHGSVETVTDAEERILLPQETPRLYHLFGEILRELPSWKSKTLDAVVPQDNSPREFSNEATIESRIDDSDEPIFYTRVNAASGTGKTHLDTIQSLSDGSWHLYFANEDACSGVDITLEALDENGKPVSRSMQKFIGHGKGNTILVPGEDLYGEVKMQLRIHGTRSFHDEPQILQGNKIPLKLTRQDKGSIQVGGWEFSRILLKFEDSNAVSSTFKMSVQHFGDGVKDQFIYPIVERSADRNYDYIVYSIGKPLQYISNGEQEKTYQIRVV